jgi:hypothetical protein
MGEKKENAPADVGTSTRANDKQVERIFSIADRKLDFSTIVDSAHE